MHLQKVNMRFNYQEAFEASRGTGYEVLLYSAMIGDATLFSRTDLVESAWRIAQPLLDYWAKNEAAEFPNYPAGSWGPKAAFGLIERDGRQWVEVINREVFQKVPLFQGCDAVALNNLAMMLKPEVAGAGDMIIRKGEVGTTMYIICRGQAEVLDGSGKHLATLQEGDFFGELALLFSQPRAASIRAVTPCDLFVLDKADFDRVAKDDPKFLDSLMEVARKRYKVEPK
jgi:glucose-6-phosphate 1-dehydrogenase